MSMKSIIAGIVLALSSTSAFAFDMSKVVDAVHQVAGQVNAEAEQNIQSEPTEVNQEHDKQFVLADLDTMLQNRSSEPFKYDSINPVVMDGISYCYGAVDAMYEQSPLEVYASLAQAVKTVGNNTGTIKSLVLAGHDDIIEMDSGYYTDMVYSKCNGLVHRVEVANE